MASRKVSRKSRNTRKSPKSRKMTKSRKMSRKMRGGMAALHDASMALAQKASLAQGAQYLNIHKGQYGGMAPYPGGVESSGLPSDMVASARIGSIDSALNAIKGMQDGGTRRSSKKSRRSSKKRGGAFTGAALTADSMLLPAGLEKQAALNNEWSLIKNGSFSPNP